MTKVKFRSNMTVEIIDVMGNDDSIIQAMLVSTKGEEAKDAEATQGRINFLMKNRHGCFDSDTEVLTAEGWKWWPDVDGTEFFATLNLSRDEIEYQAAERLVRKHHRGDMLRIRLAQVDALVTLDHRMVMAPRTQEGWEVGLHPARDLLARSHRIPMTGGTYDGGMHDPQVAELVGFIAADGHVGSSIEFHLRKKRKIEWLERKIEWLDPRCTLIKKDDRYRIINPSEDLRRWAKQTYTEDGDRCFPREILDLGDAETIRAMLDGFLEGDGSVSTTGKISCSTVSRQMVDDIQEAALKAGMCAVETEPTWKRSDSFGDRILYRLTIYRNRNSFPRIGWTEEARLEQVRVVQYDGDIHCVTVPNRTLYVRRNGKPMWCGNTPFEHNAITFYAEVPIFVFREWHRHRIGVSFNEMSGRYTQLPPTYYIPGPNRPLLQVGKPGAYEFVQGSLEDYDFLKNDMVDEAIQNYRRYQARLDRGIAKEVARMSLGINIFSAQFFTCNARSLMAMLSLRTKRQPFWQEWSAPDEWRSREMPEKAFSQNPGGSMFPSYPMWEIEQVNNAMERAFAEAFPMTHKAFDQHGRVAP